MPQYPNRTGLWFAEPSQTFGCSKSQGVITLSQVSQTVSYQTTAHAQSCFRWDAAWVGLMTNNALDVGQTSQLLLCWRNNRKAVAEERNFWLNWAKHMRLKKVLKKVCIIFAVVECQLFFVYWIKSCLWKIFLPTKKTPLYCAFFFCFVFPSRKKSVSDSKILRA